MITETNQTQELTPERFAFLEQAIWHQLLTTDDTEAYSQAWLALVCRFIGDITSAVVVLGETDVGPFAPVAFWPQESSFDKELSIAAERAMTERKGVALAHPENNGTCIAYPLLIDKQLLGVAAVLLTGDTQDARTVLRQLQWGSAWMETLLRRKQLEGIEEEQERTTTAFDLLASVLEHERFKDACNAVVTELAMRLKSDPVSIGFVQRDRVVVKSISHAAQFGERMNLIRGIASAMDEAVDQEAVILYPPHKDWEYRVTTAHEELSDTHKVGSILTIPLQSHGKVFGALTFERPKDQPFDEATVEICDGAAAIIGPVLEEKKRNDRLIFVKLAESMRIQLVRLFGANYFGRKLATAIFLSILLFFSVVTDEYQVTSPAILEGEVQRAIVAPFDGYLFSQHARPGEIVKQDQLLATLDDRDLTLERLRWITTERQRATEFDRAMAERERAQANIARAQMDQAVAQVALLDEQLARTRVKAPFDAVVVSGDLTQNVGGVIQRGEELFKLAPLNAYRVILEVDEGDIADIAEGQQGHLLLASLPEEKLSFVVQRVTPIAEQADGRNFFRVEASLEAVSERLRPGMEGIGKTEIEQRLLINIWTRPLMNWLRLSVWEWLP